VSVSIPEWRGYKVKFMIFPAIFELCNVFPLFHFYFSLGFFLVDSEPVPGGLGPYSRR